MATKGKQKDPNRCDRLTLKAETKRRLWAESGGYCQRPDCRSFLFPDDGDIDFAEMAHIVAATTGGARDVPKEQMSEADRAHHSNIAVLCANCHTWVDKDPVNHPVQLMRAWKAGHRSDLERALGTPRFLDRQAARAYIEPVIAENQTIFETYGPLDDDFSDDRAHQWRTHAVRRLVPNNAKLVRALAVNRHLLTPEERSTADKFSLHQDEFAARHVLGDYATGTSRFPEGMDEILKDDE
ncbi:hypothetical protein [Terracoccus luteus]|uniref:hypothetical protein n=1 Tax=Terracoccus luteus TaxID=53356 RepID=UPI000EAFFC97|nr:hypothetical protein [Terracoccus luteus]